MDIFEFSGLYLFKDHLKIQDKILYLKRIKNRTTCKQNRRRIGKHGRYHAYVT